MLYQPVCNFYSGLYQYSESDSLCKGYDGTVQWLVAIIRRMNMGKTFTIFLIQTSINFHLEHIMIGGENTWSSLEIKVNASVVLANEKRFNLIKQNSE